MHPRVEEGRRKTHALVSRCTDHPSFRSNATSDPARDSRAFCTAWLTWRRRGRSGGSLDARWMTSIVSPIYIDLTRGSIPRTSSFFWASDDLFDEKLNDDGCGDSLSCIFLFGLFSARVMSSSSLASLESLASEARKHVSKRSNV